MNNSLPQDPNERLEQEPNEEPNEVPKNAKEGFYDKIPITSKQLDVIIVVLLVLIILSVFLGRSV